MRVTDDPLSQRESRIKLLSFAIYTLPCSDFHICHRLIFTIYKNFSVADIKGPKVWIYTFAERQLSSMPR